MRTVRWLVIATALVAAGAAFHLLMSPSGGSRAPARSPSTGSSDSFWGGGRSAEGGGSGSGDARASSNGTSDRGWGGSAATAGQAPGGRPKGGRPLDEIDAQSREAMRNFLRESTKDGE